MTALATVDDVATVSREVPDADVSQVERLLDMVSAKVRRYVGLTFDLVEGDEITVYPVDGEVTLPEWPVHTATAIQRGEAVEVEIGSSGRLYRLVSDVRQPWLPYPVTVTYDHGFAAGDPLATVIPDDIIMVVAECAAERWNATEANPMGIARSYSQDVAGYSNSTTYDLRSKAAQWSPEHQAILDSYRPAKVGSSRVSR